MTAAVRSRGRLCVGIDPHAAILASWGLDDTVAGLDRFAGLCVEAFASDIAVVKPQVAFFERFGSGGLAVLERTIADLRSAGVLVVADAKRGDIGSTSEAYARAWLDPSSPLASDAVTVSPYLGVGALAPFVEQATEHGCGLFVLARTSNPEGAMLQQAVTSTGASVAQDVVDEAAAVNLQANDDVMGLVVGATRGHGLDLRTFSGPILAPGLGAQGATAQDLPSLFEGSSELLLPNSSRDVLRHGPDVAALRQAAIVARDTVEHALA
ncbi:orotidine-5'-phosphate decarboxylase [Rhodococcus sp. BP-349]|nr:orotidine-5'-phosphate decarboxylase [Rhodococcus sp. BP-363]MBY6544826.1 orotidine-5'-phosphate decarboxylase [Rhodococcus sp. BP-369]MBY6564056.1 orotidine-5'-phosphate decarboxylase [Rhodococcus sp. BP-370]MBY6579007.1 orotidine-5'-phosphate decarboxylase [Rhodococcus sp. BP-364]MBY6588308.1 orotidine-5'-phosphate decarboxylase [Rhodococcus sp. BP-358]MBY6592645.1 orotidine-5'-phosphate decarboxylase [Rhodococcus sp. BP-362]MBY6596323.1 orotidine-5'-phosphate decarboxylase [Rhodococcus 